MIAMDLLRCDATIFKCKVGSIFDDIQIARARRRFDKMKPEPVKPLPTTKPEKPVKKKEEVKLLTVNKDIEVKTKEPVTENIKETSEEIKEKVTKVIPSEEEIDKMVEQIFKSNNIDGDLDNVINKITKIVMETMGGEASTVKTTVTTETVDVSGTEEIIDVVPVEKEEKIVEASAEETVKPVTETEQETRKISEEVLSKVKRFESIFNAFLKFPKEEREKRIKESVTRNAERIIASYANNDIENDALLECFMKEVLGIDPEELYNNADYGAEVDRIFDEHEEFQQECIDCINEALEEFSIKETEKVVEVVTQKVDLQSNVVSEDDKKVDGLNIPIEFVEQDEPEPVKETNEAPETDTKKTTNQTKPGGNRSQRRSTKKK